MNTLMNKILGDYGLEFEERFDTPVDPIDDLDDADPPYRLVYHWEVRDRATQKPLLTMHQDLDIWSWNKDDLSPGMVPKEKRLNIVMSNSWEYIYRLICLQESRKNVQLV
jgi:oligoribonuclease NrnB/cAMP/cGMP phosphodiesterase (DHH superfamily)